MKIRIYQIDLDKDVNHVKFRGLQDTNEKSGSIDPAIYENVYDGEVSCNSLEEVFEMFNVNHPIGFRGHSLSVSDIVEIYDNADDGPSGTFFCNTIGFDPVSFDTNKTTLKDGVRVLVVEPHKAPYVARIIDDYHEFQKVVGGGLFECVYPFKDDAYLVCNEEGKLIPLEGNRRVGSDIITGTFFIARDDGQGGTLDLTDEQIEKYANQFAQDEIYTPEEVEDGIHMSFLSL